MSKAIRLAALYPEHLNLNGDHANLLVLQKRLEWRGTKAEIVSVTRTNDLNAFDLVLLGHGSRDAWAELSRIDSNLVSNVANYLKIGKPVIAISSGYEFLFEELNGVEVKHAERVSEFQSVDGVVGYLNSEADLPKLTWIQNSMLTLLHGPILAKNPALADEIIGKAKWASVDGANSLIENVDNLASASRLVAFED